MNSTGQIAGNTLEAPASDRLTHWQLRIAQRADQLAAKMARGRDQDLECWLQAEREVLVEGNLSAAARNAPNENALAP